MPQPAPHLHSTVIASNRYLGMLYPPASCQYDHQAVPGCDTSNTLTPAHIDADFRPPTDPDQLFPPRNWGPQTSVTARNTQAPYRKRGLPWRIWGLDFPDLQHALLSEVKKCASGRLAQQNMKLAPLPSEPTLWYAVAPVIERAVCLTAELSPSVT